MAGVAGLEPTNARFRVWCLTNLAIPLFYLPSMSLMIQRKFFFVNKKIFKGSSVDLNFYLMLHLRNKKVNKFIHDRVKKARKTD